MNRASLLKPQSLTSGLIILVVVAVCLLPARARANSLPRLFLSSTSVQTNPQAREKPPAFVRYQKNIRINRRAFRQRYFSLALDHVRLVGQRTKSLQKSAYDHSSREPSISYLTRGIIKARLHARPKNALGRFIITETRLGSKRAIYGMLQMRDGRNYILKQNRFGRQILQLDEAALYPPEDHPLGQGPALAADSSSQDDGIHSLSTQVVDALVLYSPEAQSAAGGSAAIIAEIQSAVLSANTSYQNSEIAIELNLATTALTSSSEAGSSCTDLDRLRTSADGYYEEAATLREEYCADVVSLFITNDTGACGCGYQMSTKTTAFAPYAFFAIQRTCISNLSFEHEIGHNMGAGHAAGDGGTGLYSYSQGWRFTGNDSNAYRTVMAYSPGTRIQYFSNPSISYQGVAVGAATANNASTLNDTASTVGAFRSCATATPTHTATITPTATLTQTATATLTQTASATSTATVTETATATATASFTFTASATATSTPTESATYTSTITPGGPTETPTATWTASATCTSSATATATPRIVSASATRYGYYVRARGTFSNVASGSRVLIHWSGRYLGRTYVKADGTWSLRIHDGLRRYSTLKMTCRSLARNIRVR